MQRLRGINVPADRPSLSDSVSFERIAAFLLWLRMACCEDAVSTRRWRSERGKLADGLRPD